MFVVLVHSLRNRVTKDELADLIIVEWGVHSAFNIESFGGSFKIIFKTRYDHGRALKIEWTRLKFNLLIILPWTLGMSLLEVKVPLCVKLPHLKERYWNDEVI